MLICVYNLFAILGMIWDAKENLQSFVLRNSLMFSANFIWEQYDSYAKSNYVSWTWDPRCNNEIIKIWMTAHILDKQLS